MRVDITITKVPWRGSCSSAGPPAKPPAFRVAHGDGRQGWAMARAPLLQQPSAWRAAWDAGWAAALHGLLLGRPGRPRLIGWPSSPLAPPPLLSWLAKGASPIVEAKVELQRLAGAGDGSMCRLAGGWPTQLCGCRVQPARRCPSKQAARWCHGYNSRHYALLCVRITKDSNSRVQLSRSKINGRVPRCNVRAAEGSCNEVHGQ